MVSMHWLGRSEALALGGGSGPEGYNGCVDLKVHLWGEISNKWRKFCIVFQYLDTF